MPRIVGLWLGLLLSFSGFGQSDQHFQIIPKPAKMEVLDGRFIFSSETTVRFPPDNAELKSLADPFIRQLQAATGFLLRTENRPGATPTGTLLAFLPVSDANLGDEGYRIDVTTTTITIEATKPAGFFYAIQSLYQLLPPEIFRSTPADLSVKWSVPACHIEDKPRYGYRGLHLDVARHFFPVSFIKKYIDLLALHKFNTFHWHLTDDQGWRIEIKKYPKLTQVGSRRKETLIGHYYESDPQQFDGQSYGGFYTQDEVREVVRYAKSKYVTIIPEIEMPGHALAILAAYPEFGCSGGPYETATKWGIFTDVLCPYDRTFTFLEDVLSEVMTLFPGPYIHIGGDECPKISWKKSPFCQNLMKKLKLKNENQLQRYFISRIDKWVTSKGWKTIGWDEILEGNSPAIRVSPGATVMSWRGIDGGLKAARQNHDVIMTPGNFLYLDHYQADRSQEPLAFGRFTPLEKTYSYDPTPADLPATAQKHLIGAQANVWTEYLKTANQVEYMVWPRAAAVAEVVWTPLDQKNWPDFTRRLPVLFKRLDALGVSYSRAYYDVVAETRPQPDGTLQVSLTTQEETAEIRYSTDGSTPTAQSVRYDRPFDLTKPTTVKAVAVKGGAVIGDVQAWDFAVSKATGKSIQFATPPTRPKNIDPSIVIDGRYGTTIGYLEEMQNVAGVKTADLTATLDLAEPKSIQLVRIGLVKATAGAILLPKQVEVAVSDDGQTFRTVKTVSMDPTERGKKAIIRQTITFEPVTCRYVRIMARNVGKVPTGMTQAGKEAWVMADEITVE
ncbi:family 20 glycosylhydrolase [Larkinella sp. C7]|uniref:glycoside hydrolase family 20 protein n=1 Tax=Larkinella sp. C7 TaxID=2576607 RepID=UPI00111129A4|nr:family 20 glycosylhydrolase [Larkinella sp. C7]